MNALGKAHQRLGLPSLDWPKDLPLVSKTLHHTKPKGTLAWLVDGLHDRYTLPLLGRRPRLDPVQYQDLLSSRTVNRGTTFHSLAVYYESRNTISPHSAETVEASLRGLLRKKPFITKRRRTLPARHELLIAPLRLSAVTAETLQPLVKLPTPSLAAETGTWL